MKGGTEGYQIMADGRNQERRPFFCNTSLMIGRQTQAIQGGSRVTAHRYWIKNKQPGDERRE